MPWFILLERTLDWESEYDVFSTISAANSLGNITEFVYLCYTFISGGYIFNMNNIA